MAKIRVAVLFGGVSSEHDISLKSAANVIRSIAKIGEEKGGQFEAKYDIICVGITKKGRWLYYPGDVNAIETGDWERNPDCSSAILSPDPIHKGLIAVENGTASVKKIDVVFPVLHGKNGEDGTLQGLLEMARIPYVGCGVLGSSACMDKTITHTILDYNGIRTAKWRMMLLSEMSDLAGKCRAIADDLGYPLFVKPANAGSSIGVSRADNEEALIEGVRNAFTHDSKVVIEECITGRELEVAVFGYNHPFASPVGEIVACKEFYDFDAKYVLGDSKISIPADIPADKAALIRETAVKAFKVMNCRELSRVDFFLSDKGEVILNEINTMPGFTSISMYPMLMNAEGMSQEYLMDKLIEQAISPDRAC